MLKNFLLWSLLLAFLPRWATGQTGSWQPAGATLGYPRTLLKASEIAAVQAALAGSSYGLYDELYQSTAGPVPGDNATTTSRRARATLAKNAAFVLLMNRKPHNSRLLPLPASEQAALLASTIALLESLNPAVEPLVTPPFTTTYTEWQWRSKELIDYLIAYDLLRGAGESEDRLLTAQARLQDFAGNLYQQSVTPYYGYSFYGNVKNNHTLMTTAALGMAAVVLNHVGGGTPQRQPTNWINTGLYHLDNVLWEDAQRQSDPGTVAGYAEGPYYFKYAFLNCLPFFRAMGNFLPDGTLPYSHGGATRSIRNPYFDPRYDQLYDWITAILMPDGRLPALEDSYVDMGMPELALTGKSRYLKPLHLHNLTGSLLTSLGTQLRDITVDMRAAYLAANLTPTPPAHPALTALPRSGNLIFRSGNDSLATYLHLNSKNGPAQLNSGGHSHGDASSFILHAQGQLLALDPGYLSYARRAEVGRATNHNLVLVDGQGPLMGTVGAANDAPAHIQNTLHTPQMTYGEVRTAYQGATITRKTLFVRHAYFLLADFVQAAAPHTYTWQLHGYGLEGGTATTGTFHDHLEAQQASWTMNGARLTAHVTAPDGASSYAKATNIHELTYGTVGQHTTLLVHKSGVAQTQFLAALYPSAATREPAISTSSTAQVAGLASNDADFQDIAFAQADTVLTAHVSPALPEPIVADGLLNFYSVRTDNKFSQAFLEQGTRLLTGTTPLLQSSKRATISWQQGGPGRYEGYVNRGTVLTLALAEVPATVSGPGVLAHSYDAAARQLRLTLGQASAFTVQTSSTPLPVSLTRFTARRQARAVQLSWQTASEQHNQGFAVQRRTDAGQGFHDLGFMAGAGNSTQPTSYSFQDTSAPAGTVYYRLAQTDLDGRITYSPVVAVASAAVAPAPELTVFPVPTRDILNIAFSNPATEVFVRLLNQQGQTVLQRSFRQQMHASLSGLAPGLYYLQALDTGGQPLSKGRKVVISR